MQETIYDEFEMIRVDKRFKGQYRKCSKACGIKAYKNYCNNNLLYSSNYSKITTHMLYGLYRKKIFRDRYIIKHNNNTYIVYFKIKGLYKEGDIEDVNTLNRFLGFLWKPDTTVLKEYKKMHSNDARLDLLGKNNTRYGKELFDYMVNTKNVAIVEPSSGVIEIGVLLSDCIKNLEDIDVILETTEDILDYYYRKPMEYIVYKLCKELNIDYTLYIKKEVVDNEYIYSFREGIEKEINALLEKCKSIEYHTKQYYVMEEKLQTYINKIKCV